MSSSFLKEMSWTEFVERKKQTNLAIIPTGACEVYGPHLPLGSDALVALKISELVAKRVNAIVGPMLEVGDSSMLDEFPGTITIRPESFKAYLTDVMDSLVKWGFQDFLFINAHAGNVPIINQIAYTYRERTDIRKAQIDYWRFIKTVDQGLLDSGELAHSHAGEAGTSVMLHLYAELVDPGRTMNVSRKRKDAFPEIMKYGKLSDNTDWGTVGDSTAATADKGKALVERSVDRIVQFLNENWGIGEQAGK